MIYLDTTKSSDARHRSGLTRVTSRLAAALGDSARPARWDERKRVFVDEGGVVPGQDDWLLTAELFSEEERPGLGEFLAGQTCRKAAIFHDAIPLRFPHTTWPRSVSRHPGYLKLLAGFDRIRAVSGASRDELTGYWRWLGLESSPPVGVLALGADFDGTPRVTSARPRTRNLVCTGIIEPRKNQGFLLEVCVRLWREGVDFQLHLVGRVNPHFGEPVRRRAREVAREFPGRLIHHEGLADDGLARLLESARATIFPTLAEGCGLPLLESLWRGTPCVCSDLPVLRENADPGGCIPVTAGDPEAWTRALRRILTDDAHHEALVRETLARPLPRWDEAASDLRAELSAGTRTP
ncbi:MAG: glycosyltransferase [Opitutaceae bacterium]|jgi:glycosyltransferase involved in cell wall biosynthesis|nr:glycosyltransferase [Opitutaceae bacterium]